MLSDHDHGSIRVAREQHAAESTAAAARTRGSASAAVLGPAARVSRDRPAIVLGVDADPMARLFTREILTEAGLAVVEAQDAGAATRLLDTRSDIRLACVDCSQSTTIGGFAFASLVHRGCWPGVGVLAITAGQAAPAGLPPETPSLRKPYWTAALAGMERDLMQANDASEAAFASAILNPATRTSRTDRGRRSWRTWRAGSAGSGRR